MAGKRQLQNGPALFQKHVSYLCASLLHDVPHEPTYSTTSSIPCHGPANPAYSPTSSKQTASPVYGLLQIKLVVLRKFCPGVQTSSKLAYYKFNHHENRRTSTGGEPLHTLHSRSS